jgi:HEAT repeat protein
MSFTWRNLSVLFLTGLVAMFLTGCPDDPFDPNTWIKKLDDSNEVERAVVELERLGDQRAIVPLGKAWEKQGRPVSILQVIIDLSKPLTEKQAKDNYKNNGKARPAAWDKALPILKKAIEEVDAANPRSIESARLAAEALGAAKIDGALDVLSAAANKPTDKPEIKQLRGQAILSLGELGDPGAVPVLNTIIREEFNPAKPEMHGAAIIALGKLKSPNAIPVLIESMYRLPFFFKQVRRSLVASGGTVPGRMKAILDGSDTDVNNLFTENGLDTYKGDVGKDPLPQAEWQKVSAKDYYAAIIAGDLYDPTVVPALIKALGREPIPSYFVDSAPGPVAQNAVLDSLRKIGSNDATKAVLDVWTVGKNDDLKPIAANVFSFVSKDGSEKVGTGSALDALGKVAADNTADQTFRLEASVAYGRLARSKDRVSLLMDQAKKYKEASDKARKEADGPPKAAYETQKTIYEAAKEKLDAAKSDVARAGGERKAPIEKINTMTEAKVAFDKVKDPFTKAKATWKALDDKAEAYKGYQRLFETHVARIEIAMHCKADAACYAGTLVPVPAVEKDADGSDKPRKGPQQSEKCKADWPDIAKRLKDASSDIEVAKYTDEEKQEVCIAQIERAMLELGKMGTAASGAALETLLYNVRSDDRLVRQSILLALPKVAGKDCAKCGPELDAAIKAGEGKDSLRELNFETQVLRSYFGGDPAAEAPAGDAGAK